MAGPPGSEYLERAGEFRPAQRTATSATPTDVRTKIASTTHTNARVSVLPIRPGRRYGFRVHGPFSPETGHRCDPNKLLLDPNQDVNETASIVLDAKRNDGKSGVMILGGGSPKNFMLQTEPQIQEVLGIDEKGHDYFLQITDARPDTGGLSGATPAEAVSWGKIDPDRLPDAVVCYLDSTVALPLLTSYAFARHEVRPLKRLFDRRSAMMKRLRDEYEKSSSASPSIDQTDSKLPQHR